MVHFCTCNFISEIVIGTFYLRRNLWKVEAFWLGLCDNYRLLLRLSSSRLQLQYLMFIELASISMSNMACWVEQRIFEWIWELWTLSWKFNWYLGSHSCGYKYPSTRYAMCHSYISAQFRRRYISDQLLFMLLTFGNFELRSVVKCFLNYCFLIGSYTTAKFSFKDVTPSSGDETETRGEQT